MNFVAAQCHAAITTPWVTEAATAASCINTFLAIGMPNAVKIA